MPDRLEEDVRATAPAPRPAFVAQLERRVEGGFAKPPKQRRTRELFTPGLAFAVCLLLAGLVALPIALTSSGGDDEAGSSGGSGAAESSAVEPSPMRDAPAAPESAEGLATAPPPAGAPIAPSAPRKVERRTQLELRTGADDFSEVTAGVLRVADGTGAIVQRSDVTERDGDGYATYDLRVPSSRLDDALAQLSRLGDVRSRSATAEDITAPYVSARTRLTDARDERRALLRALERAGSPRERADIRRRLRAARVRIARAERSVRRIEARSDRARLDVTVRSTGEAGAWTPGDALDDAGRILEVVAGVLLVVGAVLLPLGLAAAAVAAGLRLTRRRRRAAILG